MNDSEKSEYEKAKECYACKDVFGTMRTKKEEKVTKSVEITAISLANTEGQHVISVILE